MQTNRNSEPALAPGLSFRASDDDDEKPSPTTEIAGDDEDDFDFTFALQNTATGEPITAAADEIFADGVIRPVYPVFDQGLLFSGEPSPDTEGSTVAAARGELRRLLTDEREQALNPESASEDGDGDELDGVPADSYCVWIPKSAAPPSPAVCKKSRSTGSSLRWRLRDLVLGRSHSDGKDKFVFLEADERPRRDLGDGKPSPAMTVVPPEKKTKSKTKSGKVTGMDMVTAHRVYYGRGASGGGGRRSYLPYKKEVVGLFGRTH